MSSKIALFFRESWLLMVSSLFFGGLLAITNAAWSPKVAENEIKKFNRLAGGLLTGATQFESVKDISMNLGKGKTAAVDIRKGLDASGNCLGWAFVCEGSGFVDTIKLVVTTDAGFTKMYGFGVLQCSETPGFGDKLNIKDGFYQSQFKGVPTEPFKLVKGGDPKALDSNIVAITGATVTSRAVVNALNEYMQQIKPQLVKQGLITQ
ncbi:MAG: FMN-binding protein [Anaerohalosphaeraceae bacterium]